MRIRTVGMKSKHQTPRRTRRVETKKKTPYTDTRHTIFGFFLPIFITCNYSMDLNDLFLNLYTFLFIVFASQITAGDGETFPPQDSMVPGCFFRFHQTIRDFLWIRMTISEIDTTSRPARRTTSFLKYVHILNREDSFLSD